MSDNSPDDSEIRKFEREMDFREKNLDVANDLFKEAPSLMGELTEQVIIPMMKALGPVKRQQQMWEPPERNKPEYQPRANSEDLPGPQDFTNEEDNNG